MNKSTADEHDDVLDLPGEVDDVALDNAPVRRHSHANLTVEGYSRAAVQTYWRVPELKIGFDFGLQPWAFMATKTWALSHTHLDHIAALPVYVSRRRMMKMPAPTIYVPKSSIGPIEQLLDVYQRLDRGRMPCELIGCQDGDCFDLSRELLLTAHETVHTIDSLAFVVWDRRKKLKPEFHGLPGDRIRDLRLSGTEVTDEIRKPLVAYLGDSNPKGLDRHPILYESQILILEVTFIASGHRRQRIHKFGHIHLDDIIERAEQFQNELIIASHLSTRYHDQQIRRIIDRRLPASLRDRFVLWL